MSHTKVIVLWAAAAVTLPSQTFTTLVNFDGPNGANPYGALVQGVDGNFYGTTGNSGGYGFGNFFKIMPTGTLSTVYNFGIPGNGTNPTSGVILATDGNFYGTTQHSATSSCSGSGCGTVYQMTPAGVLTTLHTFDGSDGNWPTGGLIQAADGDLYGVVPNGGAHGDGVVFKITTSGTFTLLHSFAGAPNDGAEPFSGLAQASNGNMYGVTYSGGNGTNCSGGCGTVYEVTPSGIVTVIHNFNLSDGKAPYASLVQATNGSLYGSTQYGGENGDGTIFSITTAGTLTTLVNFDGLDGYQPEGGMILGTDGNLYGTSLYGGNSYGIIFELTPAGAITTLHTFDGTDGANPYGALLEATNGKFYGTTAFEGTDSDGTVFSVATGLGPFVTAIPYSGVVGSKVTILGSKLTGVTKVTFNGSAAEFTIVSATEITTKVPAGATTGKIEVKSASATLSSSASFHVLP